jgi:diguanylate cyclase (GGDEF)-like protein/PAS domain S-box-containing protein
LEIALATVADAVVATDAQEKIICLNPPAESMTGWRAVDALGKPLAEVLALGDPCTGLSMQSPLRRFAESDESSAISIPAAFVTRGGRRTQIEYTAIAMRDEAGELVGAVVVCRPGRYGSEDAPREAGNRLSASGAESAAVSDGSQTGANRLGDIVLGTDFSGRVNYFSAVSEAITGWKRADACGQLIDEVFKLVDAATRQPLPCPTARAIIENRRVTPGEVCLLQLRDGSEISLEISAAPVHDKNGGVIGAMMVAHPVNAAQWQPEEPAGRGVADGRMSSASRSQFGERLAQAIAAARAKGRYAALLHVGLDRFKQIRESLGRAAGDNLLEAVARRLVRCVRTTDTVGRQGEDVFVVLLTDLMRSSDAAACAEKIIAALQSPYRIADDVVRVGANVGIAIFPIDASEGEELLRCADFAMYQARYDGRNRYRLFSPRSPGDPSA